MANRGSTVGKGGMGLQLTQVCLFSVWLFDDGIDRRCHREELGAGVAIFLSSSIVAGR